MYAKKLQQTLIQEPAIEVLTDANSHVTIFRYIPLRHVYKKIQLREDEEEVVEHSQTEEEVEGEETEVGVAAEEKLNNENEKDATTASDAVQEDVKRKLSFDDLVEDKTDGVAEEKAETGDQQQQPVSQPVVQPETPETPKKAEEAVPSAVENLKSSQSSVEQSTTVTTTTTSEAKEKVVKKKESLLATYSFLTRLFVNNVNKQIRNDINQTNASVLDLNIFLGQGKFYFWGI